MCTPRSVPAEKRDGKQVLKGYLTEGYSYDLVHARVWDKLLAWYGMVPEQQPIARKVIGAEYSPIV